MAMTKIQKARTQLSMTEPFFSSILFKHEMRAVDYVPLAAVTPRGQILYNEEECEKLQVEQLIFLLAHEVLHVALLHSLRKELRDARLWNVACDAVINETLIGLNVGRMIEGGVRFPGAASMTAEQVYEALKGKTGNGGSNGDPGGPGRDIITEGSVPADDPLHEAHEKHGQSLSDEEKRQAESKTKMELAEARMADRMSGRSRGTAHGEFARMIDDMLEAKALPWYEQLARYMTKFINQGISWRRPNKRFSDVYMPISDREPAMGHIVIGVDTSGSISDKELGCFQKHVRDLIEQCRPEKITVLYCDSYIDEINTFTLDDEFSLHPCGGGGTDMREITDWCNEYDDDEIEACVIFTDGYTPYPGPNDMDVETVWVLTTKYEPPAHIKTLRFELDEA